MKRYTMLVLSDPVSNNNKFYEITMDDDELVSVRYGRVGVEGQRQVKGSGDRVFDRCKREKTAKGYREVDVVVKDDSGRIRKSLSDVAQRDIAGNDPTLAALIHRLATINRHQLLAATGGQITIEDGMIKTPVGMVTAQSIQAARDLLVSLADFVQRDRTTVKGYATHLQDYLTLVPQKVPAKAGWAPDFFRGFTTIQAQSALLDQLASSLDALAARPAPAPVDEPMPDRVFGYRLLPEADPKVMRRIEKMFVASINRKHVSASLKLKAVYRVDNLEVYRGYKARRDDIGNEKRLWHGTQACNVLSILKSGLIIPRGGNYTITGRMFGDGLYFSDQSTKALNYSHGYWGGQRQDNCFMFLCDVAMGRVHVAKGPGNGKRDGYHSCFAKAGKSGVINNEMIVYDTGQVNLRFLCEFDR